MGRGLTFALEDFSPAMRRQVEQKLRACGTVRTHVCKDDPKPVRVQAKPIKVSKIRARPRKRGGSNAEVLFAAQLDAHKIPYQREFRFHHERKWRSDFYLLNTRWLVEIDGVMYGKQVGRHQTADGFGKDLTKQNAAVMAGWKPLRFTPRMVKRGVAIQVVMEALE